MLAAVLCLSLAVQAPPVERDSFGVPHILAPNLDQAFFHAGRAVAEDRMWQMENSRRLARGRMAEAFGASMADSDREVLRTGYTDVELQAQLDKLSEPLRAAFRAYARGVNAYLDDAQRKDELPEGYERNGFLPEPWTELDSAAIAVRLFQLFGRGGAGEVRNLALMTYLGTQPVKEKTLDVLDDFLWLDDPRSPTTVRSEDEGADGFSFALPSRSETQAHLQTLPKFNLFELLPGLRLLEQQESDMLAEWAGTPFRAGSYAAVVGKSRSATGHPILLGAPQMGFTDPAIIHEMSISCPEYAASGMDVPGVPGIAIGHTKRLAWTLTSGVADTDDVFVFLDQGSTYAYGSESKPYEILIRPLKVKGEADQRVEQKRTMWGPVVVSSPTAKAVMARRSSYRMRELESLESMFGLAQAGTVAEVHRAADKATMSFNLFFALASGEIGYRYLGLVPIRAKGLDPRFPAVASPKTDWQGFVPPGKMPRVINPQSGLITNWNNKPARWWPNSDTPAWGRIFRVEELNRAIPDGKLNAQDLEFAAWTIARYEPTTPHFMPHFRKALAGASPKGLAAQARPYLLAFDGRLFEDSISASLYLATLTALREELFARHVGTLLTPDTFRLAIQPSLILSALEGQTKFDYLSGRSAEDTVRAAFQKAVDRLKNRGESPSAWGYRPSTMAYSGEPPVPYNDRGSYIQVVELGPALRGRSVLPPGVAESGPHSRDQVPLARGWTFKPMRLR
jgi:penicillin G amidase